MCPSESLLEFC